VVNFRPQTYVSEFHPVPGETWLRVSCSRCPGFSGDWLRLSDRLPRLLNGRSGSPESLDAEMRADVMAQAFAHADMFHDGKLW